MRSENKVEYLDKDIEEILHFFGNVSENDQRFFFFCYLNYKAALENTINTKHNTLLTSWIICCHVVKEKIDLLLMFFNMEHTRGKKLCSISTIISILSEIICIVVQRFNISWNLPQNRIQGAPFFKGNTLSKWNCVAKVWYILRIKLIMV